MRTLFSVSRKMLGGSSRRILDHSLYLLYSRVMGYGLHKFNLLIAGCCCDVEEYLPGVLRNIEQAASLFASCKVVIVESDSTDNTGKDLERWASKDPEVRTILRLGDLEKQLPLRAQRIAYCRNHYLEYFEKGGLYNKYDLLLIMDMDDVCEQPVWLRGLLSCFVPQRMSDWEAIAANRKHEYSDIWALRSRGWCEYDCWEKINGRPPDLGYDEAVQKYVSEQQIHIPKDRDWIECSSAFGGMVLYKTRLLYGCRYVGSDESGKNGVCEHVEFHRQLLEKGGKLYINPRFTNG